MLYTPIDTLFNALRPYNPIVTRKNLVDNFALRAQIPIVNHNGVDCMPTRQIKDFLTGYFLLTQKEAGAVLATIEQLKNEEDQNV